MASGNSILSYLADVFSGRRFGFRLTPTRVADWAPFSGSPEGKEDGSFGDLRIDMATGRLFVKQTESGKTGWAILAILTDIPIEPDGFAQVNILFAGMGGTNGTVDTAVLRVEGTITLEGTGIEVLQNTENGTVFGLTEPGIYQIETNGSIFVGGGATVDLGLTKNTDADGLIGDPDQDTVGIQKFFRSVTVAGQTQGYELDATVTVSKEEAAAINPEPFPNGALIRPQGTNGAGASPALRTADYRFRATQLVRFAA